MKEFLAWAIPFVLYLVIVCVTHGYTVALAKEACAPEVPYSYADADSMIYRQCLNYHNNDVYAAMWPIYWGATLGERIFE